MFFPVEEGIKGGWRKWSNEELCNLYSSLNVFSEEYYLSNCTTGEWYERNMQHTWQIKNS
jgi:hypothetical protein